MTHKLCHVLIHFLALQFINNTDEITNNALGFIRWGNPKIELCLIAPLFCIISLISRTTPSTCVSKLHVLSSGH